MKTTITSLIVLSLLGFINSADLHGEDLTTLDGKTYLNISNISVYPKQVFFNWNGERTYVLTTNVPEDFRIQHGFVTKTNAPVATAPRQPQIDPTTLFLLQNRESELSQMESDYATTTGVAGTETEKAYYLHLMSGEITMTANTTVRYHSEKLADSKFGAGMQFDLGQEELVAKVFEKFLEWHSVASTNHAEKFEKEIARRPLGRRTSNVTRELFPAGCVYKFEWEGEEGRLTVWDDSAYTGTFGREDVEHLRSLLKKLPSMKEKLAAAIRNKETQKDLFK